MNESMNKESLKPSYSLLFLALCVLHKRWLCVVWQRFLFDAFAHFIDHVVRFDAPLFKRIAVADGNGFVL